MFTKPGRRASSDRLRRHPRRGLRAHAHELAGRRVHVRHRPRRMEVAILPIGCGVLGLVFTVKLIQISPAHGRQRRPSPASRRSCSCSCSSPCSCSSCRTASSSWQVDLRGRAGSPSTESMVAVRRRAARSTLPRCPSSPPTTTSRRSSPCSSCRLISWVVVLAAYIVALVVCWARALQLYIMAAFSPDPACLHGTGRHAPDRSRLPEELRRGLHRRPHHPRSCSIAFPLILGGLTGANTSGREPPSTRIANGLTYALQYLAMCVLLILLAREERRLGARHRLPESDRRDGKTLKGGGRLGRLTGFDSTDRQAGFHGSDNRLQGCKEKGHEMPERKNTYLTLHKNFVRTDIEYTDRATGEVRTFNSVTLPKGTVIDGVDVSYYQFSPMFVNEIPLPRRELPRHPAARRTARCG